MLNKFSCLSIEDLPSDNVLDKESLSLRDVASRDVTTPPSANSDHKRALEGDAPSRPVSKPMVWIDLEMTGTFRYFVA
jgi:hypothetical protein